MAAIVVPLPAPAAKPTARQALLPRLLRAILAPRPKARRRHRRPHGPVLFSEYGPGPRR